MSVVPVACDDKQIIQKEILIPGKAFLLRNVLSPSECAHFIKKTEEEGYQELGLRFRSNDRVIVPSTQISDFIYPRIKEFLPSTIQIEAEESNLQWHIHPTDSNVPLQNAVHDFDSGTWELDGMNEQWRFCRYATGGFFKPHRFLFH